MLNPVPEIVDDAFNVVKDPVDAAVDPIAGGLAR